MLEFDRLELNNKLILTDDGGEIDVTNSEYCCMNVPRGVNFMQMKPGTLSPYYEKFPFLKWFNNGGIPLNK